VKPLSGVKLTRYARPECFISDLEAAGPGEAFQTLTAKLREKGAVRGEAAIVASLQEREAVQSTGVGGGIAIPHCFTDDVPDLLVTLARSGAGIDFRAYDGKPVRVIFLLLGNTREQTLHLMALARIARLIRGTRFIERTAAALTVEEMVRALEEEEERIS
jgi:mannitol/fructose-specific phosphotransferase system IIA component (Ntr-type)